MTEEPQRRAPDRSFRAAVWPAIPDEKTAREVSRYAFWAAVVNILLLLAVVAIALATGHERVPLTWALAETGVFVAIAVGLYFYSRIAAVAAFVCYAAAKGLTFLYGPTPPDTFAIVIAALFLVFYLHGVRGAFALAKYRRK
ncbi:MAG: hypothetical protein AB7G15_01960 [Alphaproteobacteria bacterium]